MGGGGVLAIILINMINKYLSLFTPVSIILNPQYHSPLLLIHHPVHFLPPLTLLQNKLDACGHSMAGSNSHCHVV